jgi:hypothetical protein
LYFKKIRQKHLTSHFMKNIQMTNKHIQIRRKWSDIIEVLKEKHCQLRILHLVKTC